MCHIRIVIISIISISVGMPHEDSCLYYYYSDSYSQNLINLTIVVAVVVNVRISKTCEFDNSQMGLECHDRSESNPIYQI